MQNIGTTFVVDLRQDLVSDVRKNIFDFLEQQQEVSSGRFGQHINHQMRINLSTRDVSTQGVTTDVNQYFETDGPATCLIGM